MRIELIIEKSFLVRNRQHGNKGKDIGVDLYSSAAPESGKHETPGDQKIAVNPVGPGFGIDQFPQGVGFRQGGPVAFQIQECPQGGEDIPAEGIASVLQVKKVPKGIEIHNQLQEVPRSSFGTVRNRHPEIDQGVLERFFPEGRRAGSFNIDQEFLVGEHTNPRQQIGRQRLICPGKTGRYRRSDELALVIKIADTAITGFAGQKQAEGMLVNGRSFAVR